MEKTTVYSIQKSSRSEQKANFYPRTTFNYPQHSQTTGGIPTLAYRIDTKDHRVVITGDGNPDAEFPAFCQNADLLSIECSGTAEFLATQPWGSWHITPPEIAEIATAANVKRVMIKHLVIEDITGDLQAVHRMGDQIRQKYDGEVMVGEDGLVVEIG